MANQTKLLEQKIRISIIDVCQLLYQKNLLAACDGNVSFRLSENKILITPSGVPKYSLKPKDLIFVNMNGESKSGKPSSELLMHLGVYRDNPIAKAVIHSHPPFAIAWSIAFPEHSELPSTCVSETILALGSIPIVPYAHPGSESLVKNLQKYWTKNRAMILSRHGGLSWGESIVEALNGMERISHTTEILYYAQNLKGLTYLSTQEVEYLKKKRLEMGNKTL